MDHSQLNEALQAKSTLYYKEGTKIEQKYHLYRGRVLEQRGARREEQGKSHCQLPNASRVGG